MSKEIVRTVGGWRISVLLAIIVLIAVFATVGSHWTDAHAMSATDETVMAASQTASVIQIDQTVRTEVATAGHAAVLDLTTVDNNLRSTPLSAQLDSSQTSFNTRQSSSSVIDVPKMAPSFTWALGHVGVNSLVATSAVFLPDAQEGYSVVVVSKASGVEYAPYALVGVFAAFAILILTWTFGGDRLVFGQNSSSPAKKWGIIERFGAPIHLNDKSE